MPKLMEKMGLCSTRFWAKGKSLQSNYEIPNCVADLKKRIYTDYRVRKKELLDHTGTGIALPVHSNLHHVFIIIYYILLFANVLIRFTEFKP
jgi:hypothetical protein